MKLKLYWKCLLAGIALALAAGSAGLSAQSLPYATYTIDGSYNEWASPAPYVPERIVDGKALGVGQLKGPEDMAVHGERLYVADSGNNRILVIDAGLGQAVSIDHFLRGGEAETFNNPQGIAVTAAGELYIADTGNNRIVRLAADGQLLRVYERPEIDFLGSGYVYEPLKVEVDDAQRMYVIAKGMNRGLLELDSDGQFTSFVGAPKVRYNLLDFIWKRISSQAQRDRMEKFVPTEYSNLSIDGEGFIYVTTSTIDAEKLQDALRTGDRLSIKPVQRLNPVGQDVLRRDGLVPPVGDVRFSNEGSVKGPSTFVDVAVDAYGSYSLLDAKRGRIFTYDYDGNLLHIFGGSGNQEGTFVTPVALGLLGSKLVVLDKSLGRLTVFGLTAYGEMLQQAVQLHAAGKYEEALREWERVVQFNANFTHAYIGIGKAYLRSHDYESAMAYLKLAEEHKYNSTAFKKYRNELLARYFPLLFGIAVALILSYVFWGPLSRSRLAALVRKANSWINGRYWLGSLKYGLHVIVRPFDGFWDLKHERRGNAWAASTILALAIISMLFNKLYAGYFFNPYEPGNFHLFTELAGVLLPVGLWVIANWCVTTLLDGEGTMRDVYIATCYALLPIVLIYVPMTILSNAMSLDEAAYYSFFLGVANIWSLGLIFIGMMVTHQYTVLRNGVTAVLAIAGMAAIVFLGLLFYNLIQQIIGVAMNVYREVTFRM